MSEGTSWTRLTLSAIGILGLFTTSSRADVIADFDGIMDTAFTSEAFGAAPGPTVEPTGGNPDGYLQLTDATNSLHNFASFDLTDPGAFSSSSFSFDFRISSDPGTSADGFSFSYADTSIYGTTGGLGTTPFTAEDPAAAGVLGVGFDTWSNQVPYDDPTVPTGSDYQEVSVFWNGGLVERIDDTRLLSVPLLLDDGLWHTVMGLVNFDLATFSLSIDGNPLFSNLSVQGLSPFESRILFAGRTGGENESADIDNVLVQYGTTAVPEPSTTVVLLLAAGLGLASKRRNRRRSHRAS